MSKKRSEARRRRRRQVENRIDETAFDAIVCSCTLMELRTPEIVVRDRGRVARIARGAGKSPADVRLLFKTLVAGHVPPMPLTAFYEYRAGSLADAFSHQFGITITEEQMLAALREREEEMLAAGGTAASKARVRLSARATDQILGPRLFNN